MGAAKKSEKLVIPERVQPDNTMGESKCWKLERGQAAATHKTTTRPTGWLELVGFGFGL